MKMKLFIIKHKKTGEFFKGFDRKDQPVWTSDKLKAKKSEFLMTKCQALLLVKFGAQQKPVAL